MAEDSQEKKVIQILSFETERNGWASMGMEVPWYHH